MHGKSDSTTTPTREQPAEIVRPSTRDEQAPAADGDEIAALRAIVEGTARGTGEVFFQSLVRHLATAVGVDYAFVAEFAGKRTRVRTLAFWGKGQVRENTEFDLAGTPCEDVVRGGLCHHPSGVKDRFPRDLDLVEMAIESYLGVPLLDETGTVLGHLAVFDQRPMPAEPRRLFIFRIFAARAAVELERLRAERRLAESEQRYRDLYEEAPNAYVSIDLDGRLLSVNRRATQLLGCPADELVGSPALDLSRGTPAGKTRAAEVLDQSGAGGEIAGREIEMRRGDGTPIWVSLWMKPLLGDDGKVHAHHSIWVDITDRVLAEQEKRAGCTQQNIYLQEEIKSVHNFDEIIGRSPALHAVLDKVGRVAPTDATVLICGETGTGKELFARAIHSNSQRGTSHSSRSTARRCPPGSSKASCSGTRRGPSPVPLPAGSAASSSPIEAQFSSTRSASSRSRRRRSCSASCRNASSIAWVVTSRSRSMSASSRPPTATCTRPSTRRRSARTCTIASASFRSRCPRSASGRKTSRCWCNFSSIDLRPGSANVSMALAGRRCSG